ncbi:MAG TPA: endolytic transglycosylase MltG [Thermoanaerobaculia bacterium]|nr:endolytic transglycosylase MltG [Thermoanaerobaculia bacterium]
MAPLSAARRILRIVLLLVLLVVAAGAYLVYRLQHPVPAAQPGMEVTLLFAPGTSTAEIFRQLAEHGVVSDARLAEVYYRLYRAGTHLQAGEYRFSRPMPIDDAINRMARGEVVKYTVVVPEGLTAEETFQLFWKQGIGGPQAFEEALRATELLPGLTQGVSDLEGFLFPNTYVVTRSTSARQIIDRMVDEFRRSFTPEMRKEADALGLTPRQAVTLASIVEKESALPEEGPVIASVYLNRLKKGMRLQADPTVIYALKRDGVWMGTLHRTDYAYDSPYNTYLYGGLPPGPICNPGLKALRSALNPDQTDFLYFVADDSGGHTFSRTFEEHLHAIAGVRRQRAEASGDGAPAADPH